MIQLESACGYTILVNFITRKPKVKRFQQFDPKIIQGVRDVPLANFGTCSAAIENRKDFTTVF